MTGTPNYKFDNALKLRSIITSHGTGGEMNDIEFRLLRAEIFDARAMTESGVWAV
ncbi:MAG: hypothetical protein ACI84R_002499 [Candidatus Azotimanducaceae bacterium]|jgi:hypothetical protein